MAKTGKRELRKHLLAALEAEDLPTVKKLIQATPELVNARNAHHNVPLATAVSTGNPDLVRYLLSVGADPNHTNHGGHSVLDSAAFAGDHETAGCLIEAGAEPGILHLAALGELEQLKARLSAEPKSLRPAPAGGRWLMSPLHAAARGGSLAAISLLLDLGADINARDHANHSPLALAVEFTRRNRKETVTLLLDRGADPDVPGGYHDGTVLDRAILAKDPEVVELLLARGANPNHQDYSGRSALHHAVSKNLRLTELVLARKPDPGLTTREGETALDLAVRLKKNAAVRAIREHG